MLTFIVLLLYNIGGFLTLGYVSKYRTDIKIETTMQTLIILVYWWMFVLYFLFNGIFKFLKK